MGIVFMAEQQQPVGGRCSERQATASCGCVSSVWPP
jgi:hypothetical protein